MSKAQTGNRSSVLDEAARELEAAAHDARVAFDCVALGELDRAHTSALTARVAADAAVTALQAALLAASTAAWWSAAVRRPAPALQRVSAARADRIRSP
jgi:hypothetical protein